ncbi:MAG: phosphatase PAP2 family protein [Flavobacteriales bacterium]
MPYPKFCFYSLIFFLFLLPKQHFGQSTSDTNRLYELNTLGSSIIVGVGFTTNAVGLKILDKRSEVEASDLIGLSESDVPKFERWVLNQNSNQFSTWHNRSDVVMRTSLILPAVFLFNKRIKDQWLDYSLLYLKTQAFSANFYTLGVPQFYRKLRPEVYYTDLSLEHRTGVRKANSFFSGHTSVTATSMFFMASVYHDLYPERNFVLPLAVATLTTGYVAMGRLKAGKHFLTDVLSGAIIGGAIGYLTPHFHSKKKRQNRKGDGLSLNLGYNAFVMTLSF